MDNVIRLSKFVKNLGIVTTVLFLIIVLVTFVTGNMGVAICFMPFVFLGIALILAYKKRKRSIASTLKKLRTAVIGGSWLLLFSNPFWKFFRPW